MKTLTLYGINYTWWHSPRDGYLIRTPNVRGIITISTDAGCDKYFCTVEAEKPVFETISMVEFTPIDAINFIERHLKSLSEEVILWGAL